MRFAAVASALALIALSGCGGDKGQVTRPLTVVGWGGSSQAAEHDAYWAPFVKATGVQLREDSWHGGIGVIRTKVMGGDNGWDLVQAETEEVILGCEEGLFEPVDWAALGGRDAFIESAVRDCGVGAVQWSYLIGYDGDRIAGAGPRNWADFFDTARFPGKRGMRKSAKYTLEIALLADGVPPRLVYPTLRTREGVDRAFRKLDQLRPNILWWSSISQVPALLGSGEIAMSVTSPGRLVVANRKEGRHFKTVWDGNIFTVDYWVILKNSPRKAEAMQAMRFATRPENQLRLAALIPTGVTNREAVRQSTPALRAETPTDPANMQNALELDADFWVEYGDQLTQRFNAWVSRTHG